MRSLILVILLVAAAFLGGAFVNGPGLQWAQARLLKSLGVGDGNEIASLELKASSEPSDTTTIAKLDPGPIAYAPSIITEGSLPAPRGDHPTTLSPKKATQDSSPLGRAVKSGNSAAGTPLEAKTSVDRSILTASLKDAGRQASSAPLPGPSPLDSLPPLAPAGAMFEASPSPSLRRTGDLGSDWTALVRKMESFGVKKFSIEGEPGGRIVFSCLIPLAGRQAVSQRFEAEDDDVLEAARATLRRIALWRAAQNGSP